ncbi:carboxymuconolactone decarboxylase family protein [Dictyobacter aurantiacus]|uniref:Carboxymuconolactone decarboxylase-like domain-containing protein n=1 Tax=Dictyobacter aurantiacus TaxID=1936993 RepID=A0A401Z9A4_9CHLR|nr:carboxymuconolactone decarboxylase family protein [Dictyobacter aurantiacus]GCE03451.1 hypothetical protein KDAU_07800 [Dictyobacter aurantiacus]
MTQQHPIYNAPQFHPNNVVVPLPDDETLSPETVKLLSLGAPIHIGRMLAGAEDLFPSLLALIKAIFTAEGIDPRLREIIILRTAYLTDCAYEWEANVVFARNVGLTEEQIAQLCSDKPVTALDSVSNLISRATDEITRTATLSDETLSQLLKQFGPAVTTKYIIAISWFNMLSRILLSTRVPRETDISVLESRTSPL